MKKGVKIEVAMLGCALQEARTRSAYDGRWRIFLVPKDDPAGKRLANTIEACGGSGRTEVFASGGKVTVTSESTPFGDRDAILIFAGKWQGRDACEILDVWENHCTGKGP